METTMQFEVKTKKPQLVDDELFPALNQHAWYASYLAEGLRCIMVYKEGQLKAYYKDGNEITTIGTLLEVLALHINTRQNIVFDGMLTVDNGSNVKWLVPRNLYSIDKVVYEIFDCIPYEEYIAEQGSTRLSDRIQLLQSALTVKSHERFCILPKRLLQTKKDFTDMRAYPWASRWEIILQTDTPFNCPESKMLLLGYREKDSYTLIDYTLDNLKTDTGKRVPCIESLILEYQFPEYKVVVKKGFTLQQRIDLVATIGQHLGKHVTISHRGHFKTDSLGVTEPAFLEFGEYRRYG